MTPPVREAREIAAAALAAIGDSTNAKIVRAGGGDDFPETRIALAALATTRERLQVLETALTYYADPTFWDAELPEAALAFHDRGEIARAALQGKDVLAQRD